MSDHHFVITITTDSLLKTQFIHGYLYTLIEDLGRNVFGWVETVEKVNKKSRSFKIKGTGNGGVGRDIIDNVLAVIEGVTVKVKVKVPELNYSYEMFGRSGKAVE